jgi:hypothetical protein
LVRQFSMYLTISLISSPLWLKFFGISFPPKNYKTRCLWTSREIIPGFTLVFSISLGFYYSSSE